MSKWNYQNKPLDEAPHNAAGFIYKVTFLDGCFYIGRKQFTSTTRTKVPNKVRRKIIVKESDWKKYNTSSEYVKHRLETEEAEWTILHICNTKREMGYLEAYEILTQRNGQHDPKALNKQCPAVRSF